MSVEFTTSGVSLNHKTNSTQEFFPILSSFTFTVKNDIKLKQSEKGKRFVKNVPATRGTAPLKHPGTECKKKI